MVRASARLDGPRRRRYSARADGSPLRESRALPRTSEPLSSVTSPTPPGTLRKGPGIASALRPTSMRWILRFFGSSIGKKYVMAVTGLLLVGFLVAHLAGNLLLYVDDSGGKFKAYAKGLHDLGPLLWAAELGLIGLFGLHIFYALQTLRDNRAARKSRYAVSASRGAKTLASATMPITGAIVLLFVIVHLLHFRLDDAFKGDDPAGLVKSTLASPLAAAIYLVGVGALTLHLSHAIQSALQTLGASHPNFNPLREKLGLGLAVLLGLGFASFPVYALIAWGGGNF